MASRKSLKILGISGSLRHGSSNSGLIRSAAASAARLNQSTQDCNIDFQIYQRLKDIPLYDGDVEAKAMPESVVHFCQAIAEADALLIATPEYNYSVSGVLKNAIDWASRPYRRTPLTGKPVAILGAGGVSGTSRAQYHLRQVLLDVAMPVLPKPEVMVNFFAPGKFDATTGELLDKQVKGEIERQLRALAVWTATLRGWTPTM